MIRSTRLGRRITGRGHEPRSCCFLRRGSIAAVFALNIALPLPDPAFPQPYAGRLEEQLLRSEGRQRLELLTELAARDREADPSRAVAWGTEALELAAELRDDRFQVEILNTLCRAHLEQSQFRQCLPHAEQAARLARAAGDRVALAEALAGLGHAHQSLTEIHQSFEYFSEAIRLFEEIGDAPALASSLLDRCTTQSRSGDYPEALKDCLRGRDIFEKIRDLDGLTKALLKTGNLFAQLEQVDEALQQYLDALDLRPPDDQTTSNILNNIGFLYSQRGAFELAIDYYERSLRISEERGQTIAVVRVMNNLGDLYNQLGEPGTALSFFSGALEKARAGNLVRGSSSALANIARLRHEGGEPAAAAELYEEAVEILLGTGESQNLRILYGELSRAYAEAGQHERALTTFRKFVELNRKFFDQQASRAQAELRVRFETEKQQKELKLLGQRQAVADLELARQREARRSILLGFIVSLGILWLLFHRYQLKTRAASMQEAVDRERAINRRLREVDRLKEEFLNKTSHELRAPLYGITGLTESLLDGAGGELPMMARDHLAMLVASGQRLSTLIDDVLDFSEFRKHGIELDLLALELRPVVDDVLTLLRPLVGARSVELRNAVESDLPPVLADERRLHQILHNLVGNAIKFTASGSIEVSAAIEGDRIAVRVTDTGIGIAAEDHERIFSAFEQAEASAERRFGGTGLGLTVTRQLVDLHGGDLMVQSILGTGSTFTFTLEVSESGIGEARKTPAPSRSLVEIPRGAEMVPGEAVKPAPPAPEGILPVVEDGTRILVVDDEPINLHVISSYLTLEGFELSLAASGEEALRRLATETFDLVLLDVMMPELSGYEVCLALRREHALSALPVIFLTAKDREVDAIEGVAVGANDYLTKPIAKDRLLARIRPHLEMLHIRRNLQRLVEERASKIKVLSGLLPICSFCKKIRDDEGYWAELDLYIATHSEAELSQGLCPDCVA